MASKGKTRRTKTTRKNAKKKIAKNTTATRSKKVEAKSRPIRLVSQEERRSMIAAAAYKRAEQREFRDMDLLGDWLAAEREVDQQLAS